MKNITKKTAKKRMNSRGTSIIEYVILTTLIAMICISAIRTIGTNSFNKFDQVAMGLGGGSVTSMGETHGGCHPLDTECREGY